MSFNLPDLNVPEDDGECESFITITIDSWLVYKNKYYLPLYLDKCAYKIANKQITNYLDDNLLEGKCCVRQNWYKRRSWCY